MTECYIERVRVAFREKRISERSEIVRLEKVWIGMHAVPKRAAGFGRATTGTVWITLERRDPQSHRIELGVEGMEEMPMG